MFNLVLFAVLIGASLSELQGPCSGPAEPGNCLALFPAFFFNQKTRNCEPFTYGGCGGSLNRYTTKQDCMQECKCKGIQCGLPICPDGATPTTKPDECCPSCPKPEEICPPTCRMFCENGFQRDSKGCEICKCK